MRQAIKINSKKQINVVASNPHRQSPLPHLPRGQGEEKLVRTGKLPSLAFRTSSAETSPFRGSRDTSLPSLKNKIVLVHGIAKGSV